MASELLTYTPYKFEKDLDKAVYAQWLKDEWTLSFWYSGVYLVAIIGAGYVMRERPPLSIRPLLVLWSGLLAVFSICGAVRMIPETVMSIREHGFEYTICNPSYARHDITAFWVFMFALSKVYELGDTAFIILRKQKLIFLHWYHHITVFIYTWYSCMEQTAPGRWFIVMNYTVHSFMYSYYTFRALRWFRIPKWVNIVITSMQILQMVCGLVFNIWTWFAQRAGRFCQQTDTNRMCACLMYCSYLVLFSNYFYNTYFVSVKKDKVVENGVVANGKIQNGRVENGVAKKIQ